MHRLLVTYIFLLSQIIKLIIHNNNFNNNKILQKTIYNIQYLSTFRLLNKINKFNSLNINSLQNKEDLLLRKGFMQTLYRLIQSHKCPVICLAISNVFSHATCLVMFNLVVPNLAKALVVQTYIVINNLDATIDGNDL